MPFLTPDEIPVLTKCKRIRIPDHPLIWGAVNGAMLELTKKFNWEKYGAIEAADMAEIMWPFVDEFLLDEHCEEGIPDEGECTEFEPTAPFISYAPNDPFQTPDLTPLGYFVPPWYNNPLVPLPGVLPGDAMVNGLSIAVFGDLTGLVESGLPRMRIHLTGAGQVEIELVRVPQGGEALIIIDDNLLDGRLIDLDSVSLGALDWLEDIFNIVVTAQANIVEVIEFDLETPGDHHIDITFLPKVDAETLIGFGGGLRRVSFCGVDINGDEVMPQFRTIDDGCTLQWRPNPSAAWQTLSNELCGEDGEDGTDATLDADSYRVNNCVLEVNEAGGWTPIAGASWYPINGGCPADFFYARSTAPYLNGKTPGNVDLFTYGYNSTLDRVIAQSHGKQFNIRYPSENGRVMQFRTDGAVIMGSAADPYPAGTTLATLFVEGHNSLMHAFRVNGRTGQTVPIFQMLSHNTHAQPVMTVSINGIGIAQQFDNVGGLELVNDLKFYDFAGGTNRILTGSVETDRETPAEVQYHGEIRLHAHDFLAKRTVLRGSTDGTLPTIGFLGAVGTARRTITGDLQGNTVIQDLLEILEDYGLITDNTDLGTAANAIVGITTAQDCSLVLQRATGSPTSVDLSDLNCLIPSEAEGEDRRCRIAYGAMSFFISQMYAQSCIIYNEWYPADPTFELERRLVFQIGTQDAFSAWFTELSSQYAADEEEVLEHFNRVNDEIDAAAQLYYCYLDDDGIISETNFNSFKPLLSAAMNLQVNDAALFDLWLEAFHFASFTQINAFGYFFEKRDPCTLSEQDCPGLWCREYEFGEDDFFPRWKIKDVMGQPHGNYSAGNGYQDYTEPAGLSFLKVGMVLEADAEITSVAFTFNIANNPENGGGVNVYLRDWTTGAVIDSWSFLELNNGNYTRSHAAGTPFAPDGFSIEIDGAQVTQITLVRATVQGNLNIGELLGEVCE